MPKRTIDDTELAGSEEKSNKVKTVAREVEAKAEEKGKSSGEAELGNTTKDNESGTTENKYHTPYELKLCPGELDTRYIFCILDFVPPSAQGSEFQLPQTSFILRLFAGLNNTDGNHVFGRGKFSDYKLPSRCEMVSRNHFQMYFERDGKVILQNLSINGTIVNGVLYRHKNRGSTNNQKSTNNQESKSTNNQESRTFKRPPMNVVPIKNGSEIIVPQKQGYLRFTVRIPERSEADEDVFQENVGKYFRWVDINKQTDTETEDDNFSVKVCNGSQEDVFNSDDNR